MTSTEAGKQRNKQKDNRLTVVDDTLFKLIGLDQLMRRPATVGGCTFDRTYRTCFLTVMRLTVGLMLMQTMRVYLTLGDMQMFLPTIDLIGIVMNGVFKGHVIVMRADKLHDVLDVAKYKYTTAGRADPTELRRCRTTVSAWLRVFVTYNTVLMIMWMATPWFIKSHVQFSKLDGTVGNYRQTLCNWWYPVSEATFNWTPVWIAICVLEVTVSALVMYIWTLFECYMVTVCEALSAQFRTMSAAYETLGRPRLAPGSCIRESDRMKADRYYEELINHVKDNQKIIKKYDEFVDIMKPAVFSQMTIGTFSVISCICRDGQLYPLKNISSFVIFTYQLFICCYVFTRLEIAKSSVNFGLYSCDWTEMDLKCQKTMLLAMRMNSAHKRALRVSPNYAVNLEMFARVMKLSFSIVSVLLNTREKKTTNI